MTLNSDFADTERRGGDMVLNVLWMAAMAAASVLAGFCMGRLTMRDVKGDSEDGGERSAPRLEPAWETETAGDWNVKVDESGREPEEGQWIRRMDQGVQEARTGAASQWTGRGGTINVKVRRPGATVIRPVRRSHRPRGQQVSQGQSWAVGSPVSGQVISYREGEHPAVILHPAEDRLYAPVNGKITRLFPLGNAFLFTTEFGTELHIQVGETGDDLLGRYFRPRVVRNEIVPKGRLLLEFDRAGLAMEGVSPTVTVRVESRTYGTGVTLTTQEQVKPGEELLKITERVV